jgi:hypothetical protein
MTFMEDFTDGPIKAIGALEGLAAVGLILPGITGIAPVLVPLAAIGLHSFKPDRSSFTRADPKPNSSS